MIGQPRVALRGSAAALTLGYDIKRLWRSRSLPSQTQMVLSVEGEAMNRPQGDQAMRPMVPWCPRQMHRSLIPGANSLPTSLKSPAGSSRGVFLEERTASAESTSAMRVHFLLPMWLGPYHEWTNQFAPKAPDIPFAIRCRKAGDTPSRFGNRRRLPL